MMIIDILAHVLLCDFPCPNILLAPLNEFQVVSYVFFASRSLESCIHFLHPILACLNLDILFHLLFRLRDGAGKYSTLV
jgi:hypothetical protein